MIVRMRTRLQRRAGRARATPVLRGLLAQQRVRQGNGGTALADAIRSCKDIGMGNPVIGQRIAEYGKRCGLALYLIQQHGFPYGLSLEKGRQAFADTGKHSRVHSLDILGRIDQADPLGLGAGNG